MVSRVLNLVLCKHSNMVVPNFADAGRMRDRHFDCGQEGRKCVTNSISYNLSLECMRYFDPYKICVGL